MKSKMPKNRKNPGFTLIELLVAIAIIGVLASIVLVSLNSARAKARDARRASDMHQLANALALYYSDNSAYPPVNPAAQGVGGWEVSYQSAFLASLNAYMASPPRDPINKLDLDFSFFGPKSGSYFYAYYNYPASSSVYYGCDFNSSFAVITVRQLEGGRKADTPKAICGVQPPGGCPNGGIANVCRDWSTEYDYSQMVRP